MSDESDCMLSEDMTTPNFVKIPGARACPRSMIPETQSSFLRLMSSTRAWLIVNGHNLYVERSAVL